MKKIAITTALLLAVIFSVDKATLQASENFTADASHSVNEGSDRLTRDEIIDLYNVEFDANDQLAVYTSSIDYTTPGTYQIQFDDYTNDGIVTHYRDLVVTDVLPRIELQSNNVSTIGSKSPESYDLVTMFGASATEIEQGDLTTQITIDDSKVVYNQVGHNEVTFSAMDDEGNTVTETADLYFRQLAPEVTTESEEESIIGTELTDEQLIELFEVDVIAADGSVDVNVDDSQVNYNQVGQYPVYFTATDIYGIESETVGATLDIIEEEIELTLTADATHTVKEGSERLTRDQLIDLYNVEYDSDNTLAVYQSAIDYNTPGTYDVKFEVTDTKGNSTVVITEMVVSDVKPTLTIAHTHVQALVNDPIDLVETFGVAATEIEAGDINDMIIVDDSEVDYMHVGNYPVYFSVNDDEGNTVTTQGDLYLRSDAPTITGEPSQSVPEGSNLTDAELIELFNVTAEDADGIDYIKVDTSKIDFNTPGKYSIIFTAYDIYGMNSVEYYAIIEVTDVLPTIETNSDEVNIVLGSGQTINDVLNIDATELVDNDLTSEVIIDDSQVNYDQEGSYEVVLTVSDNDGNTTSKTVTVNIVSDSTASENTCVNNAGHTNNSHNCDDDSTCNNNGNSCTNGNNGNKGNNGKNDSDKAKSN